MGRITVTSLSIAALLSLGCESEDVLGPEKRSAGPGEGFRLDGGAISSSTDQDDEGRLFLDAGAREAPDAGSPDASLPPAPTCACPSLPQACQPVPAGVPFFSSDRGSMQEAFVDLIACADRTLRIAMYETNWSCLVDALILKLDRDPDLVLEIAFDDDRCPRVGGVLDCELSRLEGHPRASLVDDQRSRFMHHKFAVVDGQRVWVGSANLTEQSFCQDLNNALVVDDPAIVQGYEARFQRLFAERAFGPAEPSAPTAGRAHKVYFSPESPISSPPSWYVDLGAAVETASTSVDLLMFAWTRQDLADLLIEAKSRGVTVRGVLAPSYVGDAPAQAAMAAGIAIRKGPVHSKVVIIDRRLVITGSPNWSSNSWENNEDSLWIEDPALAAAYLAEFEDTFRNAALP